MAKKYYWLKLKNNFFTQPRIKKLRKIAGGDTYTIIYLKMQLLSIQDDGKLYFEGIENDFAEEIALIIDEDIENVKVTINYLLAQGLLIEAGNEFTLPEAQESIGSETESAERMRKKRLKEKDLLPKPSQCDADVTQCDTEIEKEIEIEIELDKENRDRDRVDYQQIADMYNDICISFPHIAKLSNDRKKNIKARLNTYSVEELEEAFKKAEASDFLKGKNDRSWSATFDWMIKDKNLTKILEGNYDNKEGNNDNSRKDSGTAGQDRRIEKAETDYGDSHGLKMA